MAVTQTTNNVNNTFFDGYYKDIWRVFTPEQLTNKEIDFIFQYFELKTGSKVLDIMCGYGRHSVGLARKGVSVVAVDNLSFYIDDIKKAVEAEKLPLIYRQADILSFTASDLFDLVICMGNSINFFDEQDSLKIISSVANCLQPGGQFLINTWSLAEIAIKKFEEKAWSYEGEYKILVDSQYLFNPTRIETDCIMIDKDGKEEIKKAIDYIFSYAEMQRMLESAGFMVKEVFSIPGKKKFELGDPRAYIVAEKR